MQHALTHVERPGGSHEGVGRKKKLRDVLTRCQNKGCDKEKLLEL